LNFLGTKKLWRRIFGRKERNRIKELQNELQATKTELLLAKTSSIIETKTKLKPVNKNQPEPVEKKLVIEAKAEQKPTEAETTKEIPKQEPEPPNKNKKDKSSKRKNKKT